MDVVKGVGVVVVEDDMGDGMQCSDHPYRNNPGGICAFCLQEKLGKLVSSSFPLPIRVSSSSSSSPSFRSDTIGSSNVAGVGSCSGSSSLSLAVTRHGNNNGGSSGLSSHYQEYYSSRRAKIPFLLAKKKKIMAASSSTSSSVSDHRDIVFKRSKSTAATRTRTHFLDNDQDFSPRKRNGFWSFLYHSSKPNKNLTINPTAVSTNGSRCVGSDIHIVMEEEEEEDESPSSHATASAASSFERKVSRSRSVGCGSRSFSGDFFERISTGFGDCTLRRVESQREGKQKVTTTTTAAAHHHHMKEKVKCGGLFGGFVITSSSSSSSSSSYWVSSSDDINGKPPTGSLAHGRNKSWGWAFASPMRAFGPKPSSKDGKRDLNKKTTPDLTAIPSLLVGA